MIELRWDRKGMPHKGWTHLDVVDVLAGDGDYAECDMCGKTKIRWLHIVDHPEVAEPAGVGCDCAEKLTDDYANPQEREQRAKSRSGARSRWLARKGWKAAGRTGNPWIKYKGMHIVVYRYGAGWRFRLDGIEHLESFATENAAKFGAFDEAHRRIEGRT